MPAPQPRLGPKSALTVGEWVRGLAAVHGDREAVVGSGGRLTYRELDGESRTLARGLLARGVGKETRIGLWLGNGPAWMVAFAAIARCGAVAVPLSTFFSDEELALVVRHADLQGIIVHPRFLGDDQRDRLAKALPELSDQGPPPWAIKAAPHLRWLVSVDQSDEGPPWSRDLGWLVEGSTSGTFDEDLLSEAEQEVHPDDDAIMIYTSGSTAMPKGVPHSHRTIMEKTHYLREWLRVDDGIRSYTAAPFFWVGGLTMSLFVVLDGGGTQVCTDRFVAGEVLALIGKERIERAVLYPHQIMALLEHPDFAGADRSSLREADPRLLLPGAEWQSGPDALRIGLGMTETFGGYWWGRPEPGAPTGRLRADRRPPPLEVLQPGMELRVVNAAGQPVDDGDLGEVWLRGPTVTRGFYKTDRDGVFDNDGWFHTGDRVAVDGHRLHFRGRLNDMIKTSGANVAPSEVVTALREVDGVREAYVLGLPDPVRGQVVVAAVILEERSTLTEDDLRRALRARLSTFKVPGNFVFLTEAQIPWTPSFKVRYAKLAELLAERIDRSGH
ncbi:MAG TPA: class I adenylate-forming enzyme family protein [Acidimicrobiales bacterium]|jgi:acyl-CoA synthetase (AMP-forming)/AMP-acid ligase II|nr:class I adenylate-forming enzyme family protein [Acidimicrobiales bacterium]